MISIRRVLATIIAGLALAIFSGAVPTAAAAASGARAAFGTAMCTLFDGCHENRAREKSCKVNEKCNLEETECVATVEASSCAPGAA
jgi:hypothetical protein